ncbi:MAG: NAD-dependent epimerase/dehydratase family protein [Candidatus Bathyarchaeia archaeon]
MGSLVHNSHYNRKTHHNIRRRKTIRDVLYINDLIQALDAFLQKKNQLAGEVFNIGGEPENTLSLLELLDLLEQLTGKEAR